jgi:hypothetical protein
MSKLIGLCGVAGSGKTTVANILVEKYGFQRVAFADPLKDMLKAVGFTHEQLYGSEKEVVVPDLGVTPRHAMQTLGTEWGRQHIGTDFWVKLWMRKVQALRIKGIDVVCDDIRFRNEAAAVRSMGGGVIAVFRPTSTLKGYPEALHSSETGMLIPDRIVHNDGDLQALEVWVDRIAGST